MFVGTGNLNDDLRIRVRVGAQEKQPLNRRLLSLPPCYNDFVALKDELLAYQARWAEVEVVVTEERRTTSLETRWQQLNAAYAMAKGFGLLREDPSERGVFERWAKLREKAARQLPKV